ncbi:MAG: acylphosphatase [Anaerolineae bacterium]|nr:acylphosphatase [Anaerolineae bacterium]
MSEQLSVGAIHVIVHGFVQGVGFRYFVLQRAQSLGLKGWVRNLNDGTVEVHAEGAESRLQQLLMVLSQGPRGSRVTRVEHLQVTSTGSFIDFRIC